MKFKLTLLIALISTIVFAQSGINYKALIKDTNGNIINNQGVDIVFSIEYEGTTIYSELQQIITDNNGIAIATIGQGTNVNGVFESLPWHIGDLQLNVQIDFGSGLIDFGNSVFNSVPYAIEVLNKEGLVRTNSGWRLEGVITDGEEGYGNVGINATDLSVSNANGVALIYPYGATGRSSFATGRRTVALGDYSTALGFSTIASEDYSTALGRQTEASGEYSTAMGLGSRASSFSSTSIGRYNIGGGNFTVWSDTDPLFEIGNGSSASNRHNALTVLKNGQHTIYSEGLAGLYIDEPNAIGLFVDNAGSFGAWVSGTTTGIRTQSTISTNPDIILGGDNGIISSQNTTSGSDLYLRSYNDIIFELDEDDNTNGALMVRNSNANTVLSINEFGDLNIDGFIQIGTETIEDTGSNQLSVDASLIPNTNNAFRLGNSDNRWIGVWATDGTINTSDRREKKNIKDLKYGLKEVLQMQPVSYNWKNKNIPDTKLGLIAQDLLELIPEVVKSHTWEKDEGSDKMTKNELDRLGVYYSDLIPVLINAIKEQQTIIENQSEALKTSKSNYEALLSRIELLETKKTK